MSARLPEHASAAESVDRHRRQLLTALPMAALLTGAATSTEVHAKAEPIEPDEDLLFLPSTARDLGNGQVEVDVQIWIHEKNRFKLHEQERLILHHEDAGIRQVP